MPSAPPLNLQPNPHPPTTDEAYATDEYTEGYYQRNVNNQKLLSHQWRLKWVYECLQPQPGDKIADLGCGPGTVSKFLASKGAVCQGVDLSDTAITFAKRINEGNQNQFRVCDASNCDHLQSGTFDKALSCDVTEHCGYDIMCAIFREACRLLKPGGLYFVYTNNPKHWIELLKARNLILKQDPTHTGLREASVIIDALEKSGFEIVRHPKPPSMIPVFQWFEKLWSLQPIFPNLGIYRVVLLARKRV
jgi:cyclopropane fatty-acyl-phospholipid synthase-like methyltransferase